MGLVRTSFVVVVFVVVVVVVAVVTVVVVAIIDDSIYIRRWTKASCVHF
jgi:hypothetical protein